MEGGGAQAGAVPAMAIPAARRAWGSVSRARRPQACAVLACPELAAAKSYPECEAANLCQHHANRWEVFKARRPTMALRGDFEAWLEEKADEPIEQEPAPAGLGKRCGHPGCITVLNSHRAKQFEYCSLHQGAHAGESGVFMPRLERTEA